jgi:hypothetical protein
VSPATTDAALQALTAGAIALSGVCILGAGMFVAYAARIFRAWKRADE